MTSSLSFLKPIKTRHFWGNVCFFTAIGPPVGNLLILSGLLLSSLADVGRPSDYGAFLLIGLVGFFFAYLLGSIPALMLGLICAFKPRFFLVFPGLAILGLIGATISMMLAGLLFSTEPDKFTWTFMIVFFLTGAGATMLTGLLYRRFLMKRFPDFLINSQNVSRE